MSRLDKLKVGIVGGGIAGVTAAIKLAQLGISVSLFERKPSLVYGPPICHLHAGGNLYREIDEQQCLDLLRQSIESVRLYPHTINRRPTILAVPKTDKGDPLDSLNRLERVKQAYGDLVDADPANKVLGEPAHYYKTYSKQDLHNLQTQRQSSEMDSMDEWVIPFAKYADLEALKYPVIIVQEYGWSLFRLAASAQLILDSCENVSLKLSSEVTDITSLKDHWRVRYIEDAQQKEESFDYLINACGFETGVLDNLANVVRNRLVEFKAAYVAQWQTTEQWPEVVFYGERGTVNGMAQLTPYPDGIVQLHGMTDNITLFRDGLVQSSENSAQPMLPDYLRKKIDSGWTKAQLTERSELAIEHMSRFIPAFSAAKVAGKPLFGAQQIPGANVSLRAADVYFHQSNYACIEIVKGSSAVEAVDKIIAKLAEIYPELIPPFQSADLDSLAFSFSEIEIEQKAIYLAEQRGYPTGLAKVYGSSS